VPSALSKIIAALEQDVGFRLMHRSTRRLTLTDEGAAYYKDCRQLLLEFEEAEANARAGRKRARGTLRVGMHPALRHAICAELGRFLDEQPEVKVETVVTNTASAVLDEGLDLVLRIGHLADSSLIARPLGNACFVVCASPAYLERYGEPQHPRELTGHRAVIFARRDEEPSTRWEFERGKERHVVEVPVRLISRDGVGLVDAAAGGCGIARPFDLAAHDSIAAGRLHILLRDWSSGSQPIHAVLPPMARGTSAKVSTFLAFTEALLARSTINPT
jgi:LysR family transcriptional regulator, regulator for bpeEF and oprC